MTIPGAPDGAGTEQLVESGTADLHPEPPQDKDQDDGTDPVPDDPDATDDDEESTR